MKTKTVNRYENLLKHLAVRERGCSSLAKVLTKFRVSAGTGKILQQEGLMSKDSGVWKWSGNGTKINSDLAQTILSKVNADVMGSATPKAKAGKKRAYTKRTDSFVVNLTELRKEREALTARIAKINRTIDVVEALRESL